MLWLLKDKTMLVAKINKIYRVPNKIKREDPRYSPCRFNFFFQAKLSERKNPQLVTARIGRNDR